MPVRDWFKAWSSRDVLTAVVSLTALSLSAASFYRSHYYVSHAVTLRVLETSKGHTRDAQTHKGDSDEHTMTLPLIFINTGNRDAMVLKTAVMESTDDSGGGGILDDAGEVTPFILKTGDIKVVNLEIAAFQILFHAGSRLVLQVEIIDASGRSAYRHVQVGNLAKTKNDFGEDVAFLNIDSVSAPLFDER